MVCVMDGWAGHCGGNGREKDVIEVMVGEV